MGEVYRADHTRLDREVAIKVLPESLTADPERLRRFEQMATHDGASYMLHDASAKARRAS